MDALGTRGVVAIWSRYLASPPRILTTLFRRFSEVKSVAIFFAGMLLLGMGPVSLWAQVQMAGVYGLPPSGHSRVLRASAPAPSASEVATRNFIVRAPDSQLAQQAARLAEQYRRELSLDWLGYEIAPWNEKVPVQVIIDRLPGGETSFAFVQSENGEKAQPIGWQMKVFGPPDRVLDAVLPHEITHTIFATHFGRPLPRWADEGACTTVEHESERAKNHRLLIDFLTTKPSRGIPFNRMFTMTEYPHDILPLYAQGYSLAKFLIRQKDRRTFVNYIGEGLERSDSSDPLAAWNEVTGKYYGYKNLSDLQLSWLKWVESGSPLAVPPPQSKINSEAFADTPSSGSNVKTQAEDSTSIAQVAQVENSRGSTSNINGRWSTVSAPIESVREPINSTKAVTGSWYRQQMAGAGTVKQNTAGTAKQNTAGTAKQNTAGTAKQNTAGTSGNDDTIRPGLTRGVQPEIILRRITLPTYH